MNLARMEGSAFRFAAFLGEIVSVIGHLDRERPQSPVRAQRVVLRHARRCPHTVRRLSHPAIPRRDTQNFRGRWRKMPEARTLLFKIPFPSGTRLEKEINDALQLAEVQGGTSDKLRKKWADARHASPKEVGTLKAYLGVIAAASAEFMLWAYRSSAPSFPWCGWQVPAHMSPHHDRVGRGAQSWRLSFQEFDIWMGNVGPQLLGENQ
jgi:hypothetical protein